MSVVDSLAPGPEAPVRLPREVEDAIAEFLRSRSPGSITLHFHEGAVASLQLMKTTKLTTARGGS